MSPSPTGLRFHLGHRPALDGLRGIAILSVLGSHVSPSIVVGGGAGVDLFFVLSGFLITCLLVAEWDRNERISLSKFYARRALRLFPALFVYLVGCYVLAAIFQQGAPREATQKGVFYALFYVANWARVNHVSLGLAETTWSLSIEEQFYIFWPLLLILGLKYLSRRTLVKVVLALVAVVTLHRLGLAMRGADYARVYNGSDTRADGLLMGCALAMFVSWRGVPRGRWVQVVGALSGLFFLAYVARNTTYTAWSVASTSSLLALSAVGGVLFVLAAPESHPVMRLLSLPALVWVGRISYSLYLWHFVAVILLQLLPIGKVQVDLLQYAASFVAAVASHELIERPFLRLKERFTTTPSRPPVAHHDEPVLERAGG